MTEPRRTRFKVKMARARWHVRNFFQTVGETIKKGLSKIGLGFLFKLPPFVRAMIYLAPALAILGVFTFYPIFNSVFISFLKDYNMFTGDRKSTRLNSSHVRISYAVFCLKKKIRTTSRV